MTPNVSDRLGRAQIVPGAFNGYRGGLVYRIFPGDTTFTHFCENGSFTTLARTHGTVNTNWHLPLPDPPRLTRSFRVSTGAQNTCLGKLPSRSAR